MRVKKSNRVADAWCLMPGAFLERVKGIEPSYRAWEARVLPLNYTRKAADATAVIGR